MESYSHTQKAPMCLIYYGTALLGFALTWLARDTPGIFIFGGVGLVSALYASAVHYLTVVDQGEAIAIRFGPLPFYRKTVKYAAIEKVEIGRTLLDGWGMHYSFSGGRLGVELVGPGLRDPAPADRSVGDRYGRCRESRPIS
jgi:hypothetical protein